MTNGTDWQQDVGRNWAELYAQTDRALSGLTERLLARLADVPAREVLDVGCGAGELALAIARNRPHTRVTGLDISPDLIAAARARGAAHTNARFELGDAAAWREDGYAPDLIVSRHGVMFFADPVAAFAHLYNDAAPGAQLVFSCFRAARENGWAADIARMIGPAGGPAAPEEGYVPGPFAFADPQLVEAVLTGGGWRGVDIAPVDFAYVAGAGADPVADARAFFTRIGPAARALRELEGEARSQLEAQILPWLEAHRDGDLVIFPAAAWIVTARRD